MRWTLFLLLLLPLAAAAHGDLHDRIQAISRQLEKDPDNAELLLRRGELHRAHAEFDQAIADYDRALQAKPRLTIAEMAKAQAYHDAGWPHSALAALNRYLGKNPETADALTLRGRVQMKLKRPEPAARDFQTAIRLKSPPPPELYLDRAEALAATGSNGLSAAVASLDDAMRKAGPLITLQLYALDYEVKQQQFEAALKRLETIKARSPRKETWLAREGEIFVAAGRKEEARRAFGEALTTVRKLPTAQRQVPAMVDLENRIIAAIQVLNAPATNALPTGPAVTK